jgi:hypothetical protein
MLFKKTISLQQKSGKNEEIVSDIVCITDNSGFRGRQRPANELPVCGGGNAHLHKNPERQRRHAEYQLS